MESGKIGIFRLKKIESSPGPLPDPEQLDDWEGEMIRYYLHRQTFETFALPNELISRLQASFCYRGLGKWSCNRLFVDLGYKTRVCSAARYVNFKPLE